MALFPSLFGSVIPQGNVMEWAKGLVIGGNAPAPENKLGLNKLLLLSHLLKQSFNKNQTYLVENYLGINFDCSIR